MTTDMKEQDLKPCPFCGGQARLRGFDKFNVFGYDVKCDNCQATTKHFTDGSYFIEHSHGAFTSTTKFEAARAWNCRPNEGTYACPDCGIDLPHTHAPIPNRFGPQKHYLVVLTQPTNP